MPELRTHISGGPFILAVLLLPWPAAGQSQTSEPKWSLSFDIGGQKPVSGEVLSADKGFVLGFPTEVMSASYDDIYGTGFYVAGGVGYRVLPRGEVRGSAGFTMNAAERIQVGSVPSLPLFAQLDDYKAFALDVGYRQYVSGGRVQPFIGGVFGFTRVDTIEVTLTVPAVNATLPDVPFYRSSVVPSAGFSGGVQFLVNGNFALQGGVDLRWHGDLKQNEGLEGTDLEAVNDHSSRWAMPITGGVSVRF
jgi:hypothetical protein